MVNGSISCFVLMEKKAKGPDETLVEAIRTQPEYMVHTLPYELLAIEHQDSLSNWESDHL